MSNDEIHQAIADALHEHARKVAEARERACEAAVQSGGYGVLETWHGDGSVEFSLSAKVPYGNIYVDRGWT